MKTLHAASSRQIESRLLPGPSAVIRMADEAALLPEIKDKENVVMALDCVFADEDGTERSPNASDAKRILEFVQRAEDSSGVEHIVAQCQAGAGRSVAVCAALEASRGGRWENMAAYNRTLYRLLLEQLGRLPMPEPLVSLAVRVKYSAEHLMGFLISLRHQRYDNWEAVAFTDGLRPDVRELLKLMPGAPVVLIENSEQRGRWGHPYRQAALEHCQGEWIGTNNDDNYLMPGYIEQMVMAGQRAGAQLVLCHAAHRYAAWGVCKAGQDLACWLARKELVRQVPWTDTDFLADERYLNKLIEAADGKVAEVPRPLVVKN
jgi:hypothetical protein